MHLGNGSINGSRDEMGKRKCMRNPPRDRVLVVVESKIEPRDTGSREQTMVTVWNADMLSHPGADEIHVFLVSNQEEIDPWWTAPGDRADSW